MNQTGNFPATVYIDTISVCNARCPFCPLFVGDSQIDRERNQSQIMPMEIYRSVVEEISAFATRPTTMIMSAAGETLQDPAIVERLDLVRAHGLGDITCILTNAQFLTEKAVRAILSAGVRQIVIGFDGATKEVYEAHRVRCNYEHVIENIRRFVEIRREVGGATSIRMRFVRTRRNEHELEAAYLMFAEMLNEKLDIFDDALAMDWRDNPPENDDLYFMKYVEGAAGLDRCWYVDDALYVHSDGKIAACCMDYNLEVSDGGYGRANEQPLLDIYRGQRRMKLVDALANRSGDMPKKCAGCGALRKPLASDERMKAHESRVMIRVVGSTLYRFPERAPCLG